MKNMEATIATAPLNSVQLHLLKVFSFTKSDEGLKELQTVLFDYYRNKLKSQTDEFWENNHLDHSKMEEIMYGHNRISVK
jgi:hypothetical protein